MKSLITPAIAAAVLIGGNVLLTNTQTVRKTDVEDYAFNPTTVTQNLCGPLGAKRGLLFRPGIARLLSNAANASEARSVDVPILTGLDHRDFPISSKNAQASAYFRQGFALLYAFNHWEAIRAFKKAQELDPNCAICFWGEAIALGPNINAPMTEEAGAQALSAVQKAGALKEGADARELALIEAAEKRYNPDASVARGQQDQDYADAMAAVHAAFPDDQDIATLYAEAIMDTSPWDYWERDYSSPHPHIKVAIDTINNVLETNPDHYGSIHLFIHLYEASTRAQEAAVHADKLAGLAPGSGHLVHMPGHIYFRIGRYLDSLDTNIKAAEVDELYLSETKGSMLYRYGYYPHNIHFILVSAQMAGDGKTALEYAEKLDSVIPAEVLKVAEWIAPIKAAPYFAHSQFASVAEVEALPDPGDKIPYLKAMWHYARGKVFAEAGDNRAGVEKQAIEALMKLDDFKPGSGPAGMVLQLASNTIAAKVAMSKQDFASAVDLLRANITLQNELPYTEPPHWYYAVEQSLAAVLYMDGKYSEAEDAFKASLIRHPNSAGSLYGLWQTQQKLGLAAEAEFTKALFEKARRGEDNMAFIKL